MIAKDWILALADALQDDYGVDTSRESARPSLVALISEHCPFKLDVAYMPVPRCDGCRHWGEYLAGDCPIVCGQTAADFGCVRWEAK